MYTLRPTYDIMSAFIDLLQQHVKRKPDNLHETMDITIVDADGNETHKVLIDIEKIR